MRKVHFYLMLLIVFSITACNRKAKPLRTDTMNSGNASIATDDCFAPIIKEEIDVFQGLNPDAKINPVFTNEVNAMNLLLKDSLRLVVVARDLTSAEFKYLKSQKLRPRSIKIAVDGIALIINNQNKDTLITVKNLKKILTGEINDWKGLNKHSELGKIRIVFDNPNSSTVRYIKDSICRQQPFSKNVRAQTTNQAVIDFVSKTPNAIGIIGVNWVCNPRDSNNLSFIDKIRVMSVSEADEATEDNSYQPFAAYLVLENYPLRRDIYMITSDVQGGLPAGIMNFIGGNQGQRIILKSGLVPETRPMRLVSVKDK